MWNWFDWICYASLIFYYLYFHSETKIQNISNQEVSYENKIFVSISLLILYYRFFIYLKVIHVFTNFIGMINIIFLKLLAFFGIMFYVFMSLGFVMIKLNGNDTILKTFETAYVWLFLGGVEVGDFENFKFAIIIIFFGTVLMTIVLLNVLIAYLSNIFGRLEEQQNVNYLKEKASMILNLEIIGFLFKHKLSGQLSKFFKYEKLIKQRITTFDDHKSQNLVNIIRIEK